jgi:hypothetical protein
LPSTLCFNPLYAHCATSIGHLTIPNLKPTHFKAKLLPANSYYIKWVYHRIWKDTEMQIGEGERAGVKSLGKWRIRWKLRRKMTMWLHSNGSEPIA